MSIKPDRIARCLLRWGPALTLTLATNVAPQSLLAAQSAATPPPLPAGMARIWVYRAENPYDTPATPYIRLNGEIIGVSEPGGVLYRDVPPRSYAVTVDSERKTVDQFVTIAVSGGQQTFVKVLPITYTFGDGGRGRNLFYTWLMSPEAAAAEISRLPAYDPCAPSMRQRPGRDPADPGLLQPY